MIISLTTLSNDYFMPYTVFFLINTLCALLFLNPIHTFENSVDSDQLASDEAS